MRLGATALMTSRVAMDKARHAEVKQFATFEVAEQETMSDVLTAMRSGDPRPEGNLRPPAQSAVDANLDAQGRTMVAMLQETHDGDNFDREYVTAQLHGHRELLRVQEDFLGRGGPREQVNAAKLARATITEHIAHLEMLQGVVAR